MRIEISNYQQNWQCDSPDPKVIGAWFASMARQFISPNAAMPPMQMRIWPSTKAEHDYFRDHRMPETQLTWEALEELADVFIEVARMVKRKDNRVALDL